MSIRLACDVAGGSILEHGAETGHVVDQLQLHDAEIGLAPEIRSQVVPEFEHDAGGSRATVQIVQRLKPNPSAAFRRGLAFHLSRICLHFSRSK
ncbi:MAG: hypothetical protein EOS25_05040 [Mesorhizobium sp.]|uniref:hypothetical protein n=1 Tax=Mesorhizobium sp. TaxID=1871066 RepID=UPI000FE4A465|nr:hypothetical protein [Mesorhizobium sp.]RWD50870.1 MAG: hypothetical protein EOS59_07730 [Mesorhizobium sp.]RWE58567.1 MAG: hypothetical protein EOS24_17550 [Mesorhizobium sp.]RWF09187.1 MAG: hypothetical protein EOS69_20355 [Mesorhizobium sp.]RWF21398.1 MAG: hypothetical protein EOS25_05040 [Mesorhizobium sp.]